MRAHLDSQQVFGYMSCLQCTTNVCNKLGAQRLEVSVSPAKPVTQFDAEWHGGGQGVYLQLLRRECARCRQVPVDPVLCLSCGQLLCCGDPLCGLGSLGGPAYCHAMQCGEHSVCAWQAGIISVGIYLEIVPVTMLDAAVLPEVGM